MLKSITPGPGNCNTKLNIDQDAKVTQFNKTGKYFYSAFKTVKSNSFSITSRKHFADVKKTPGPGTQYFFLNTAPHTLIFPASINDCYLHIFKYHQINKNTSILCLLFVLQLHIGIKFIILIHSYILIYNFINSLIDCC